MDKKILIPMVIVILIVAGISVAYFSDNPNLFENGERTRFNVSSEGPYSLVKLVLDIKNNDYFDGYDNETLKWMESLGDKSVFSSDDGYIIMDNVESGKIPSQYVTDVFIYEHFSADVIEKHSLNRGNNSKDVIYVKNIEYLGEEVHNYGLA